MGLFGWLGPAATLGQRCPCLTQSRCIGKMTLKCEHIGDVVSFGPLTTGNIPQQKNFPFHEIHSSPLSLSLGVRKYVARGPGGGARVERKRGGRADHLESERASERRIAVVSGRVVAYCDCDRISPMPKQCRFTSERRGERLTVRTTYRSRTLVRETTRALGGGCSLRSYCFIIPIDGAVTGALNFAACVKMVSPPMRFFNRVSASYLSGSPT